MKTLDITPGNAIDTYQALRENPDNDKLLIITRMVQYDYRKDTYGVLFTRAGDHGGRPVYHAEPYWQREDQGTVTIPWCNVIDWESQYFGEPSTGDTITDKYLTYLAPNRLVTITGVEAGSIGMTNINNLSPIFAVIDSYNGNQY